MCVTKKIAHLQKTFASVGTQIDQNTSTEAKVTFNAGRSSTTRSKLATILFAENSEQETSCQRILFDMKREWRDMHISNAVKKVTMSLPVGMREKES